MERMRIKIPTFPLSIARKFPSNFNKIKKIPKQANQETKTFYVHGFFSVDSDYLISDCLSSNWARNKKILDDTQIQ